jgi:hypothetical protein
MTDKSTTGNTDRYHGRPLLMVLESYVLAAIGELPREKHRGMSNVVRRAFGGGVDWMATVREAASITSSVDEELRTLWSRNRREAEKSGSQLRPEEFALMVAEQNFGHLLDPPQ